MAAMTSCENTLYTHDLFSRMQRVCLVLGTSFSQDHDEVLSLATLVPPPSKATVQLHCRGTGVLYTS